MDPANERADRKLSVEQGYDRIAWDYLATKPGEAAQVLSTLILMTADLPDGATVLDLGCGAGVPSTQFLSRRFDATGVDVSAQQLELARTYAPNATLIKSDMVALSFPEATFDLVVAFYSIIHVPREEQPALVGNIFTWLKPSGRFLATWPLVEWEGEEKDWQGWGATMWWSHFGGVDNLRMLREAGFVIESVEEHVGEEDWLWVVARKE
ncbi:MAG TPA: class I SAM-dependent methyltransferase [Chloroflexia bacterium]|nr:class I SAM-dependent methyltransferase [Chloroflexia bacterium]